MAPSLQPIPSIARPRGMVGFLALSFAAMAAPASGGESRAPLAILDLLGAEEAAVFESSPGLRVGWFDENGDGIRDQVEDVYLYDLESQAEAGSLDRAIDWQDLDGDGQADRQLLLHTTSGPLGMGLSCFFIQQMDRERGFWHTVDGTYVQDQSQFRSDFHGDSFFAAVRWDAKAESWIGFDENPFCFYDPDGDGTTEEALRVSAEGLQVRSLRWSFDTDDDGQAADAHGLRGSGHDYDLSLTGILQTRIARAFADTLSLRGGGSFQSLAWDRARAWAAAQNWYRVLLAFDENDRNVDPNDPLARERWEGVIAFTPGSFPAVGGPDCGPWNKRYEQRDGLPGPPELYFHPFDGRVHLRGAFSGWIDVDRDGDGIQDARLEMADRDGDGYFDTWFWDGDGDGAFEAAVRAPEDVAPEPVGLDFPSLLAVERRVIERTGLRQGERFRAELDAWTEAGRFVPVDSLAVRARRP